MSEKRIERLENTSRERLLALVERRTDELRAEGYLRLVSLWGERPRGLIDRLLRRPIVLSVELRFVRDGSLDVTAQDHGG
jgi:hypothetical protein